MLLPSLNSLFFIRRQIDIIFFVLYIFKNAILIPIEISLMLFSKYYLFFVLMWHINNVYIISLDHSNMHILASDIFMRNCFDKVTKLAELYIGYMC